MKRLLFLLIITLTTGAAIAQPKRSRVQPTQPAQSAQPARPGQPTRQTQQAQQKKQQGTQTSQGMSRRMQISYPVAFDMPEDVVWRRDIYREINLNDEANSGLYYPVQPQGKRMPCEGAVIHPALSAEGGS